MDTLTIVNVPELRIIDDDLWQATKARQAATRHVVKAEHECGEGAGRRAGRIVHARRPKYLFSGLTRCGLCGGGFILSSHDFLICFNARSRGTCENRRSIKRQDVEARAMRAMRERFLEPGAFAAFCEGFTTEMTVRRREHLAQLAGTRRELAAVERRLGEILKALGEGYRSEAWKAELVALDAQKAALTVALAEPPLPAMHPQMADVFRKKATRIRRRPGARRPARRRAAGASRVPRQDRDSGRRRTIAGCRKFGIDVGRGAGSTWIRG